MKYLVLIFFIFITANASDDKAFQLFSDKKYKESSEIFYDRYLASPFDTKNSFNLALSYFYGKNFDQSLTFFKKVAASETSLRPAAYLFMAKIYYEQKKFKSSTATLGKAMSFKSTPGPIFMSMLDLWELLNKKNLDYQNKGKEFLNTIDIDNYLSNLDSFKNEALTEKELSNMNNALEFFQLAWVLNPEDKILENIVKSYLILGDEDKATRLLVLVKDSTIQDNLAGFLSERKDQISRKKLRSTLEFSTPSGIEFKFNGGIINDSNPVTKKRIENQPIDESNRIHIDMGLNLNPYVENDLMFQIKTRFISDRISNDPITEENDQNNSALLLSSFELPVYLLSKSTRLSISPVTDFYKINNQTIFSTMGINIIFEKYFSRYATVFNSWYKINNGVAFDFYDGQNWGGEAGVYRYTKKSYFGLGGGYRKERGGFFGSESFSFYEKFLTMKGQRKLSKNLIFNAGVTLSLKSYYSVREDEKINLYSTLSYELVPMTSIELKYDFFDNGSTVSEYDFNQHQIGVHLVGDYF